MAPYLKATITSTLCPLGGRSGGGKGYLKAPFCAATMSQCPAAPLERQDTVLGIWGVPGGTRSGVFKFFLILAFK